MVAPDYSVGDIFTFTDDGSGDGSFVDVVQEAVNQPGYAEDMNIGWIWDNDLCNWGDLWYPAAYDNVTYAASYLTITYKPRRTSIVTVRD